MLNQTVSPLPQDHILPTAKCFIHYELRIANCAGSLHLKITSIRFCGSIGERASADGAVGMSRRRGGRHPQMGCFEERILF